MERVPPGTAPLWGVGLTRTVSDHTFFLHDGRARNLTEAILWHGGEAQKSRDAYAELNTKDQDAIIKFLNSLILFPPDDTASTLDPGNHSTPGFPQFGHGSIKLSPLFNDPTDPE